MTTSTSRSRTRKTVPELRTAVELSDEEKVRAQAWFEDKVVRAVRDAGHCSEALAIMDKVFGKPLDTTGVYDTRGVYGDYRGSERNGGTLYPAYLDSDGVDCWGNTWRDRDGYDRAGFNRDGYDRDGFNKDGRDRDGYDRDGNDVNGINRNDPSRYAYDAWGYTAEGFDRLGYDRAGYNRDGVNALGERRPEPVYAFDVDGRDVDGYDWGGYDREGNYSSAKAALYAPARRAARNVRLR